MRENPSSGQYQSVICVEIHRGEWHWYREATLRPGFGRKTLVNINLHKTTKEDAITTYVYASSILILCRLFQINILLHIRRPQKIGITKKLKSFAFFQVRHQEGYHDLSWAFVNGTEYTECQAFSSPVVRIVFPPPPHSQASVTLPPFGSGGGGGWHTRLRERGRGESQFGRRDMHSGTLGIV